jgi:PAS domain S-box-containing protein
MTEYLRVLILEDRLTDAELMVRELERAGYSVQWKNVQNERDYVSSLNNSTFDVILADFSLPQYDALRALHHLQHSKLDIPFIIVTGSVSEEIAVECMKQGAADYLLKDRMKRLGQAVERALQDKNLRQVNIATEDALRASEARYRQMFEKNNAIKLVIDPALGQIVDANAAACAFYGYSRTELTTKNIIDLDPEDDDMLMESDSTYYVTRHRLASGELRDIEAYSGPIDVNGRKLLFSIIHDITERKRVETALKRSEEHFRALIENSTELMMLLDTRGTITYTSPSFGHVLGYQASDLFGYNYGDFLHTDDQAFAQRIMRRLLTSSGEPVPAEIQFRDKMGSYHLLECVLTNLTANPAVGALVLTGRDITERRRLEQERITTERLAVELEKEKEMFALRQSFMARVAHDFKTPLAVIAMSNSSLQIYYEKMTDFQRTEKFAAIARHVDYLNNMINDVLMFGKAREGRLECNPNTFNLPELCESLLDQFYFIDEKTPKHTFQFINRANLRTVMLDAYLLHRILLNLLSNAMKYSPGGTTVELVVDCEAQTLILYVIDHGIGIPKEDQRNLFEPFYRAANTRSVEGTGLGLSVVKSSVEACGGSIACQSDEGQGTTFTLRLPLQ